MLYDISCHYTSNYSMKIKLEHQPPKHTSSGKLCKTTKHHCRNRKFYLKESNELNINVRLELGNEGKSVNKYSYKHIMTIYVRTFLAMSYFTLKQNMSELPPIIEIFSWGAQRFPKPFEEKKKTLLLQGRLWRRKKEGALGGKWI